MALRFKVGKLSLGKFRLPKFGVRGNLFSAFAVIAGMAIAISAGAGMVLGHLGGAMGDLSGKDIPRLAASLQRHAKTVLGEDIPAVGTPLYADARLYGEHGIPGVIYGAGPRTVRESNAKRADEHLELADLRRATKVVARALLELMRGE